MTTSAPIDLALAEDAPRRRRRLARWIGASLAVVIAAISAIEAIASTGDWRSVRDHQYLVSLDGADCGRMRRQRETDGPRNRLRETTSLRVLRDGTPIEIEIELEMTETSTGEPLEVRRRLTTNGAPSVVTWTFEPDRVEVVTEQAGRRAVDRASLPPRLGERPWLTPLQAEEFLAARRAAGASRVEWSMLSFERGLEVVDAVATRVDDGTFRWQGRAIPVARWEVRTSGDPLAGTESWSEDGRLVEAIVRTGLGDLRMRLVEPEVAATWRSGPAPDVLRRTAVPLEGRLPRGRIATLRVSLDEGELPALPRTASQQVLASEARSATLRVGELVQPRWQDEEPPPAMLASTSLADLKDPALVELARDAGGRGGPPAVRAERMRRFVRGYIRDVDLESALASASEIVRSRRGDCSEHAVLLAALLRLDGIPARMAVGLVHADRFAGKENVFAWHAWTQAWIDGRWIDLDATLARTHERPHVMTSSSDLSSGPFDPAWSAVLPLMGAVRIAVVEQVEPPSPEGGDSR